MMFDDIRKNKYKSFGIVVFFFVITSLVIYFATYYVFEGSFVAVPIALIFAFMSTFFSYYNSDKIVLRLNKARPANAEEDRELRNILEGLCLATGLPLPKLYIVDDPALNAFATGRNPDNAVICFTTGLINKLDKYELEGVMAHELSHIKNYDILLQTIAAVMAGLIVIIGDWVTRSTFRRNRDNDNGGIIAIIAIIFVILAPIIARLMRLALSRNREYLADASAVAITRNPKGMIDALTKLSEDQTKLRKTNNAVESLYIVSPLKNKEKDSIWSTHPTLENRINKIKNIQ